MSATIIQTPAKVKVKVKVKVSQISLQAWAGPEGSRRLRLSDLKTLGTWRW
jgi:hypothetical protein